MDRKEYDANLGLQEGRRVNPGAAKLPKEAYMRVGDFMVIGVALLVALALLVEYHAQAWEFLKYEGTLWDLLKSALAVVISAGR